MGFTDKLKDWGLVETEGDEQNAVVEKVEPKAKPPAKHPIASPPVSKYPIPKSRTPVTTVPTQSDIPAVANVSLPVHLMGDPAVRQQLLTEINSAAPPLYVEFQEMLERMKVIANPSDRYKAALAALKVSPAQIVQAMHARFARLDQEIAEYAAVIEDEKTKRVGAKQKQIADLNAEIARLSKDLESIRNKIAEQTNMTTALQGQISAEITEIEHAANVFNTTAEEVRGVLTREQEAITQNLA